MRFGNLDAAVDWHIHTACMRQEAYITDTGQILDFPEFRVAVINQPPLSFEGFCEGLGYNEMIDNLIDIIAIDKMFKVLAVLTGSVNVFAIDFVPYAVSKFNIRLLV